MPELEDMLGSDGPKPKKGKKVTLDDMLAAPYDTRKDDFFGSSRSALNPDNFRFQLKTNADNELLRAQDQGFLESVGVKAANLIPNIVTGIGEMIGYAGSLATEFGDDRDYSNNLTRLMRSWKDPFGEVYREHPNETFDIADSAWWINHIGDLAESATEFAIPGGYLGKGFKALAGMAAARTGSRVALKVADGLAQVGTAASLAYAEGAMSGYDIYEKTFNVQYAKALASGLDGNQAAEIAKHRAAEAASTTVQMNTLMNTALNMTALAPLFRRSEDEILTLMRGAKPAAGETGAQFLERMGKMATDAGIFSNRKGITSMTSEALQEGLEEVNTQYAEAEGTRVGEGKSKNLLAALTDFDQAISDVTNEEGALNFILGAFGGIAQTAIIDNIPLHKTPVLDASGKPLSIDGKDVTRRVSSRTLNADGTRKYFDNIASAIAEDIDWQQKKLKELKAAVDKKDELEAARIRAEMFDVLALNSVQMGMGQQWINTFEEMASTSNDIDNGAVLEQIETINDQMRATDDQAERDALQQQKDVLLSQVDQMKSPAMEKGLAMNAFDDSYKQRAREAIEDIKAYQKLHDQIYARYNSEEEQQLGVADYLYGQAANVYRQRKLIERGEEQIAGLKADYEQLYANPLFDMDKWSLTSATVLREIQVAEKLREKMGKDVEEFNKALDEGNTTTVNRILEKYRIVGEPGMEKTISKLQDVMNDQIKRADEVVKSGIKRLEESPGYVEYKEKNPGKDIKAYQDFLVTKVGRHQELTQYEADLGVRRAMLATNQAALDELMSNSGNVRKVIQKLTPEIRKRNKEAMEKQHKLEVAQQLDKNAAAAHNERNRVVLETAKKELEYELQQVDKSLIETNNQIRGVKESIRNLKATEHIKWNLPVKAKILALELKLRKLNGNYEDLRERQITLQDALELNSAELLALSQPAASATPDAAQAEGIQDEGQKTRLKVPRKKKEKASETATVRVSPAAAKLATANGIDVSTLQGSGKNGTILKGDVLAAMEQKKTEKDKVTQEEPAETSTELQEALAAYKKALDAIPPDGHDAFRAYEELLKEGKVNPEDDTVFNNLPETQLAKEMSVFFIFGNDVYRVLEALRNYVRKLPKLGTDEQEQTEERSPEEKWDEATEVEKLSAPTLTFPDQPVTENPTDVEVRSIEHVGMKAVSMLKINVPTLLALDYKDKKGNYRIAGRELNPNLHPSILDPIKLLPGTKIRLEVDREFNGTIRRPGTMNKTRDVTFADYTDDQGRITNKMNVPIRILDVDGNVLGYLPTWEWMMDSYPGADGPEGLRNLVTTTYTKDGKPIDNVARQQQALSALREKVVTMGVVETTIESKGPGQIMMNIEPDGKRYKRVKKASTQVLPDTTLQFGVIQEQQVMVGKNNPANFDKDSVPIEWNNAPVVIVPMANGTKAFAPIYMDDLDSETDIATVERAILLYLKRDDADVQDELNKFKEMSGYDLRLVSDLRRLIVQQFTYLQSFNASHTAHNPEADNQNFLFNISDPETGSAVIMVGFANSGEQPIYANLKNKQLSEGFRTALREGLRMRTRTVNFTKDEIRGVNHPDTFNEFVYTGKGWKKQEHRNYNEYLKTHSRTYVNGTNKMNGGYVYAANPMITFSRDVKAVVTGNTQISPILIPEDTSKVDTTPGSVELGSDELEDFSGMLGIHEFREPSTPTSIKPTPDMQLITLDMLRDLHNFTAPGDRNGKTPEQVYEEMLKAGIPYLDEGHNPFIKCG